MVIQSERSLLVIGNLHSSQSSGAFLSKFASVLGRVAPRVEVISSDQPSTDANIEWQPYDADKWILRIGHPIRYVLDQIALTCSLVSRRSNHNNTIILPTAFILPAIIERVFGKRVLLFVAQKPTSRLLTLTSRVNFGIADSLVIESESVKNQWKIHDYMRKISLGSVYVDTDFFNVELEIERRGPVIGYLGNLEERKGILELLRAIPDVLRENPSVHFLIGGSGSLNQTVRDFSIRNANVKFIGPVPQAKLPSFYNSLRLLILPSHSEGLPNVILEGMACGTPVLATRVGGIPDLIEDNETGFLMDSSSPDNIARNIHRALSAQRLTEIAKNARSLVEREYGLENAIKKWTKVLRFEP